MSIYYPYRADICPSHRELVGSVFWNKLKNEPVRYPTTWPDFVSLMGEMARIPRDPVEKDGVRDHDRWLVWPKAPAICPAEYPEGALRRKVNVRRWHWFGADIDNDQGDDAYVGFSDMQAILEDLGLAYVLHTTTKSRPGRDRYRLLMPLERPIEVGEFSAAWNSTYQFFGRIFDASTHDPSRLLFAPAAWDGSNVQFASGDGSAFDVDVAMAEFPPKVTTQPAAIGVDPNLSTRVRDLARDCARTTWTGPLTGVLAFLTPKMEQDFRTSPEGGRLMRLMTQIAMNAISKGYPISATELAFVAENFDRMTTGKMRHGVLREAERALAFAAQAVSSSTSFESRYARNLKRFGEGR